jgi:hypothetical protein
MFGVYRVLKNGDLRYVPRTVTHNKKLAEEIAADFTWGDIVMPDGSIRQVKPVRCIAKEL